MPRKNAELDALERERERNYRSRAWITEYISLLNMSFKLSDLYGPENPGLCPGNFIVLDQRLEVPALSEKLEDVRQSMKQFMDTLKVEEKLKKSMKQAGRPSDIESHRFDES